MPVRRLVAALGAAALAVGLLPLPLAAADGPDQIVVGAALPLTGEESRIGGYFKLGYELAVKEINDRPLIDNLPISRDAVEDGPREYQWRSDAPSTLVTMYSFGLSSN